MGDSRMVGGMVGRAWRLDRVEWLTASEIASAFPADATGWQGSVSLAESFFPLCQPLIITFVLWLGRPVAAPKWLWVVSLCWMVVCAPLVHAFRMPHRQHRSKPL